MKKFTLSKFSRVMIVLLGICSLILIITTTLEQKGIRVVYTPFNIMGSGAMIVGLIVWVFGLIFKRLKSKTARYVVGFLLSTVGMMIAVTIFTFLGMFCEIMMPMKYASIESPAGQKVVIVHAEDTGLASEEDYNAMLARMNARVEKLNADAVAAGEEPSVSVEDTAALDYPTEARGYAFAAYPMKAGLFFDTNVTIEGTLYRGYTSQAKILYEWLDESTVRFYLENAEPGDEGEFILYI